LRQARRVVAQIKLDRAKAENFRSSANRPHQVIAKVGLATFNQRILKTPQIGDEFIGVAVASVGPAAPVFEAGDGGPEPAQHASEKLAIRLAGIALGYQYPANKWVTTTSGSTSANNTSVARYTAFETSCCG
jgi:hypothetical protein